MRHVQLYKGFKLIKEFDCQLIDIVSNENTQSIEFLGIPGRNKGEFTVTHRGNISYNLDFSVKTGYVYFNDFEGQGNYARITWE
jgi:hypothetical protein